MREYCFFFPLVSRHLSTIQFPGLRFVFHNVDPEQEWQLREQAPLDCEVLQKHIRGKLPGPKPLLGPSFLRYIQGVRVFSYALVIFSTYNRLNDSSILVTSSS